MGWKRFIIRAVALPLFVALVLPTLAVAQGSYMSSFEGRAVLLTQLNRRGPKSSPMHGRRILGTYSTRRQLVGGRRRRRKSA